LSGSKYVIVHEFSGKEVAIIFDSSIDHNTIRGRNRVIAAGYFYVSFDKEGKPKVITSWKSASLGGIKSRPGIDDILIAKVIGGAL